MLFPVASCSAPSPPFLINAHGGQALLPPESLTIWPRVHSVNLECTSVAHGRVLPRGKFARSWHFDNFKEATLNSETRCSNTTLVHLLVARAAREPFLTRTGMGRCGSGPPTGHAPCRPLLYCNCHRFFQGKISGTGLFLYITQRIRKS